MQGVENEWCRGWSLRGAGVKNERCRGWSLRGAGGGAYLQLLRRRRKSSWYRASLISGAGLWKEHSSQVYWPPYSSQVYWPPYSSAINNNFCIAQTIQVVQTTWSYLLGSHVGKWTVNAYILIMALLPTRVGQHSIWGVLNNLCIAIMTLLRTTNAHNINTCTLHTSRVDV